MIGVRRLRTQFVLAGILLALITVGVGLWSAWTFASLGQAVDRALRDNQETIDLATSLAGSLEREDDALLLAIGGAPGDAAVALAGERHRGDETFGRLRDRLVEAGGADGLLLDELAGAIAEYRVAGSELIAGAEAPDALRRYHDQVNPLLRRSVQACDAIRERNFASIRRAGLLTRDEARFATWIVLAASAGALVLATVVAARLAQAVVPPIRALADSVEAIRRGDFDHRVAIASVDEFGRLADGFNRMAETLAEYRRSSLGELLAAKTTLEATLEALPDAVFVIAPDGRFAALNPSARAVLDAGNATGADRIEDLPIGRRHRAAVEGALAGRATLPTRADFDRVIPIRLGDRPRKLLLSAVPIPGFEASRTGAVVVLDDVTEFALLDELRGELIAVASHELKSPLTTLRMNLLLLAEEADTLPPIRREMLDAAITACEDFAATIDELLDVTRIEAGQLRLELGPVDVLAVLDESIRKLRPRIEDAGVPLEVHRQVPMAIVQGDASRLKAVLTNLLSNALKYSPPGGRITVKVAMGQDAGPGVVAGGGQGVQITVTDTGPGIPEAFRTRVFEKFFRVENMTDRLPGGVPGTGIGLYLCREIVRAHDGTIRCDPGVGGVGTTFTLSLRVVDLDRSSPI